MKKKKMQMPIRQTGAKNYRLTPSGNWEAVSPLADYLGLGFDDRFKCYSPPINRFELADLPRQNAQHCGILNSRANMISSGYVSGGLSKMAMRALCLNLVQFGDVGLLKIRNGFGQVVRLEVLSPIYLRCTREGGYRYLMRKSLTDFEGASVFDYQAQEIIFIKLYDPIQSVYGVPDYIGGIQSAMLNSEATIFRRRYYSNGAHMGFILYTTDPDMTEETEEEIAKSIQGSQGVGNFRSMFVNIAGGNPDGVKVIPIGDSGKKDEFGTIKNVSAQDILTAHRYPAGLAGIIPSTGSFGDPLKMREAYRQDEVLPMQALIMDAINQDPEIKGKMRVVFANEKSDEIC